MHGCGDCLIVKKESKSALFQNSDRSTRKHCHRLRLPADNSKPEQSTERPQLEELPELQNTEILESSASTQMPYDET